MGNAWNGSSLRFIFAAYEGIDRVDELLSGLVQAARRKGAKLPFAANTAYVNTIATRDEPVHLQCLLKFSPTAVASEALD